MASYAALLSLKSIIKQVQHHPRPPVSLDENQVQSLVENVNFLLDFLEDYSHICNEKVGGLQSRIAEAAYEAEDVIEYHIVDRIILDHSTTRGEQISFADFYQGLQKVIQHMDFIKEEVMEIKEKMRSVRDIQLHRTSSIPVPALRSSSNEKNTMVGFDHVLEEIMDKLTRRQSNRQIIPIVVMGGIGETTLTKNIYKNPLIVQHFDIHAWTTISQEYKVKEIIFQLLRSQGRQGNFSQTSEEELGEMLYKNLYGIRYLIIMDDIWNTEARDKVQWYFPHNNCEGRIIITSRLSNLASHIIGAYGLQLSFLNENKSWNLFCRTVFGKDSCPPELEESGKEIAKRGEGLPLSIVMIGGLLAKSGQTQEYWEYIAKNLSSVVNLEDNERCLNLLYMSYNYLLVHRKLYFLYMGVYGEDDKIRMLELIKLWVVEGILKPIGGKGMEEVAEEYIKALVDRNFILIDEWKRNGKLKLCKMHDLLRGLCLREAEKDKFVCVTRLQSLNKFPQDITTQRRISVHRTLWPEKDEYYLPEIHDAFHSAPLARSLIDVSLKILPSCKFRLARILKSFDSGSGENHSIKFPFLLVNLRYIAITANWMRFLFHKIPSTVYLLWNLHTLIVDHIPTSNIDIWKMPLLQHVKLMWLYLEDPEQHDFILRNLQTLSTIGNFKCGEEVVKRIPNIQKLKFFYNIHALPASNFSLNNLTRLHKLESLHCSFLSELSWSDLVQNPTFQHSLKKLTLRGCNLQWGDISTMIGPLPHLQELKLDWDSFQGPEWETIEGQFLSLKFLKFCGTELECWSTEAFHFPRLEHKRDPFEYWKYTYVEINRGRLL